MKMKRQGKVKRIYPDADGILADFRGACLGALDVEVLGHIEVVVRRGLIALLHN